MVAKGIVELLKLNNFQIYYILNKIHRSKIDLNRPSKANSAFNRKSISTLLTDQIHDYYHRKMMKLATECVEKFDKCLFIDLHGFSKPHKGYPDIIFGHVFGNTLNYVNYNYYDNENYRYLNPYWGFSELLEDLAQEFYIDSGFGISQYNLSYSGGYITHQFYGWEKVNAIQIEVAKHIRTNQELMEKFINIMADGIIKCMNHTIEIDKCRRQIPFFL